MQNYALSSLELHLFFGRIMKEHAFFLEIGYTAADPNYKHEAKKYKEEFEKLLCDTIRLSDGVIGRRIFESGELITEYTLSSEKTTSELAGAEINFDLTMMEAKLWDKCSKQSVNTDCNFTNEVKKLNQRSLQLLECLIAFKQETLNNVLKCRMFTINYPLLLEHIIREAKLYQRYIMNLENGYDTMEDLKEVELFWNQIMMEHALFIRGLLDPSECDLISTADDFAGKFAELLKRARCMTDATIDSITDLTLKETMKYRDFKEAGTKGINECGIKSLIVPLLADHVLREANHYIRILNF